MSTVIKVENLSKSYVLKHQRHDESTTLRDVIYGKVKNIFSKNSANGFESSEIFWALKDVSFDVKDGERIGIIGRNGAGKSTLLKMLSRISEPTKGKVSIKGRVASLLEVGTGFHPELTGRENIFLNGSILGMSNREIKNRFDEIVAFAEVEKFLDTPVKRYSSGMYVRLAFAVAAHLEPEILIVDEVLAVGDAQFQKKCLGKMQDVSRNEGRTVLFVSHNMAAIQNLCSKCLFLINGSVRKFDSTEEVINDYLQSTVSSSQISLRDRKDRNGNGAIRFTTIDMKDEQGNIVNSLQSGRNGKLCIHFTIHRPVLNQVHLSLGIDDSSGQRITNLNNESTDQVFSGLNGDQGTIEIHLKRIPLRHGLYTITLYSTVGGEISDWVQNAGTFNVEAGDFYSTGKLPPEGQGSFFVDYNFQFIK